MKTQQEKRRASKMFFIGGFVAAVAFFAVVAATDPNLSVQRDLDSIRYQKEHIALHKEQLKDSRANDNEMAQIEARKNLKKAKADLKRDKAYLKADRKALIQTRENDMGFTASAMKESKRDLCSAKKQLKKDLRQGNSARLVQDAELVAKHQRNVDRHEAKLARQQASLNGELTAINNRLDEFDNEKFAKKNGQQKNGEQVKNDQERFAWNATASTDKTYYPAPESSAVLEK